MKIKLTWSVEEKKERILVGIRGKWNIADGDGRRIVPLKKNLIPRPQNQVARPHVNPEVAPLAFV